MPKLTDEAKQANQNRQAQLLEVKKEIAAINAVKKDLLKTREDLTAAREIRKKACENRKNQLPDLERNFKVSGDELKKCEVTFAGMNTEKEQIHSRNPEAEIVISGLGSILEGNLDIVTEKQTNVVRDMGRIHDLHEDVYKKTVIVNNLRLDVTKLESSFAAVKAQLPALRKKKNELQGKTPAQSAKTVAQDVLVLSDLAPPVDTTNEDVLIRTEVRSVMHKKVPLGSLVSSKASKTSQKLKGLSGAIRKNIPLPQGMKEKYLST